MVPEPTIIFSPAISSALSILLSGLVLDVEAQRVFAVGGEIELLFRSLVTVILLIAASYLPEVTPAASLPMKWEPRFQPEALRHQPGDIRLAAEQGFVVIGKDRQRRRVQGRHRDGEFPRHRQMQILRQQGNGLRIFAV